MLSPRYVKALRDLAKDRTRALMVMVALFVGAWGLTTVLASTTTLNRELRDNFLVTHPPSMALWLESDTDAAALVGKHPGVALAERRDVAILRMLVGDNEWLPLHLFVVEDLSAQQVATFELESGRLPQTGEMLLERDGLRVLGLDAMPSQPVVVKLAGQERQQLSVSGLVHDPGQSPSHMEHRFYGYVSRDTAEALGLAFSITRVVLTVRDQPENEAAIRDLALSLGPWLDARGATLERFDVPPPLRHPHQGQLESLMFLQVGIGGLAFLLSGVLIVTMFSSLLSRQVREIGVMKAVGARPSQLVGPYLAMVLVPTVAALMAALPVGLWSANQYALFVAAELNFDLIGGGSPFWVIPVAIAASLGLSLLAAAIPVLRGTRVGVREALMSQGTPSVVGAAALANFPVKSRTLLLALRNSLRNPGRMGLTAIALSIGVSTLLIGLDVGASLSRTLSTSSQARTYDVELIFAAPVHPDRISDILAATPGVVDWDELSGGRAFIELSDGPSNEFAALIPSIPPPLPLLEGGWGEGVVMNQELRGQFPEIELGTLLRVRMGQHSFELPLTGVVEEIGMPRLYLPASTRPEGEIIDVQVRSERHDIPGQQAVLRELEERMEEAGIPVQMGLAKAERMQILEDHLIIIVSVLTIASLFVLGVGGLGLVSTMNILLLERRRELAVLRAIGATPHATVRLMMLEGTVMGALGWVLGAIVSIPVGKLVASGFGLLILEAPLRFTVSWAGLAGSAVLVLLFTAVISAIPTWCYSFESVRDALSYE